jgi:nucleotide-binding universal stress UspA family protein
VVDPDASPEQQREAEQRLDSFARGLHQMGLQAEAVVAVGDQPAAEILRQVEQQQCDLIALATRDRNLLGQAVMGSVTNQVVRSAPAPVLAVTPEKREQPADQTRVTSILVPLDGSSFAEAVLPYVEFLARKLDLSVVLVRVLRYNEVYPPLVSADMAALPRTAEVLGEAERALEDEIISYLQGLAGKLGGQGLNARWEVLRGPVSSGIATLVRELPDSIIALASRGRSGLLRWVLGSVAEELLRGTGNPVLIIPSTVVGEDEDEKGDNG